MNTLKNIKNVLFDLGGVVLDIDHDTFKESFKRLFGNEFDKVFEYYINSGISEDFERGLIASDIFRETILGQSTKKISFTEFDEVWNSILIDFRVDRLETIKEVKETYNTFLLSNTNIIHYEVYTSWLRDKYHTDWSDLFNIAWFSHELNERKPDAAIYKKILHLGHLRPEETLFFDDLKENLDTASQFGIQTFQITKDYGITAFFDQNK